MTLAARHVSSIPEREKKQRAIGITYPWDKWQILVVTVTLYNIFVFYAVVARAMESTVETVLDLIETLLLLLTIGLWVYLSVTDPCIAKTEKSIGNEYWCRFCQAYYDGEKRKHCRHCKKCVIGFDHHCFFLNTCIADHNYKQFMTVLCTYTGILLMQVVTTAIAIHRHIQDKTGSEPFGDVGSHFFLWTSLILSFPSFCGAAALLGLHLFFIATGTNTFKWLKQEYEEEKLRAKLKAYELEMTRGIEALNPVPAPTEAESMQEKVVSKALEDSVRPGVTQVQDVVITETDHDGRA
eukprot:TRINITY_DN9373_c0_g1_i5.p1 TRINITY_DN9373_c0_g1~~TRINITY_DN9373_c0_g1_i5.p1  ORF type:complete len:296 (-),score=34.26 TRINITY_DN9373_c0_g1_i5:168-1055(-)